MLLSFLFRSVLVRREQSNIRAVGPTEVAPNLLCVQLKKQSHSSLSPSLVLVLSLPNIVISIIQTVGGISPGFGW